jgi:hypothetical protein
MSDDWELKILCMGAGYVGGPTMAVIAKQCPKVRPMFVIAFIACLLILFSEDDPCCRTETL